jgi:hypothetical protein
MSGGWGLVRAANTQLVLRFEADSEQRLEEISGKSPENRKGDRFIFLFPWVYPPATLFKLFGDSTPASK